MKWKSHPQGWLFFWGEAAVVRLDILHANFVHVLEN
jgi:hypothetical protein